MQDDDITSGGLDERATVLLGLLFAGLVVLAAADLTSDLGEGAGVWHMVTEGLLLLTGLAGLAVMLRRFRQLSREAIRLHRQTESLALELETTAAEASRWREEARTLLDGLGVAIDHQFTRWKLTPAEKEVGLLLLKGLSHKEVAAVRSVSSATARQQARALYKKAGLTGRNELAAFFLEDLLLPPEPSSTGARGRDATPR